MKVTLIAIAALACSFQALAQAPSFSEESFCADREDESFVKELVNDSSNLMAFQNQGGIANGGVCWWHSRFQRNALYLTIYKPELSKPSKEEARELVKQIRAAKNIIVIPGYRNFYEFSYENRALIQRELEKWQKGDGVLRAAWVRGLSGRPKLQADKLKTAMDKMYQEVEVNKNIAYNKLQIPGIDAHAWLVVHMEKVEGGYDLEILDSNYPRGTQIYQYTEGDVNMNYHGYFSFTPYLENTNEMEKIKKVIQEKCKSNEVKIASMKN